MATTNPSKLPGAPVDPSAAQGAQIPIKDFKIPDFPPSARGLKALTLTSGIDNADLGFPPGFLAALASRLPNVKSVVLYSQLFAGTSDTSHDDAVAFFKNLPFLRALHLLDVFARPGFFPRAAEWLSYNTSDVPGEARRGLMFLEVNYTFRHEDPEFMAKIQATELPKLIGPGLISCSFNIATPEIAEEDDTDLGSGEGVMAFNTTLAETLVRALTDEESGPKGLRALNCTLYTMSLAQLRKVLEVQKHVMVLNVTLEVQPGEAWKKELMKTMEMCKNLEKMEVVANPSMDFFMALQISRSDVMSKTFPSLSDMKELLNKCTKLSSLKASILRTTSFSTIEWESKDGKWAGGLKGSAAATASG